MKLKFVSNSEQTTMEIAKKIANTINNKAIISLVGDLGAGKTTFSKGFALGLGIQDVITSPTFTIMNEYGSGRLPLYHFDMYRLSSAEEAINCGFEEYFDENALNGVVLVEWASNVEGLLPNDIIEVCIKKLDENNREIIIDLKGWKN